MSQLSLTKEGREELALALLLWKDFKSQGKMDYQISMQALKLAKELDCMTQYEELMSQLPPMKIEPR